MSLIGMFIFLLIVGVLTAGIGFFVYYILLELAHISQYALVLTVLLVTIVEIIRFILFVFADKKIELNPKIIWQGIKNFFKKIKNRKNKDTNKHKDNKNNSIDSNIESIKKITKNHNNNIVAIMETVILVGCLIYAIIFPPHSLLLNFIYSGLIARILYGLFIPLIIINAFNYIKSEGFDSMVFGSLFMEFVFAIALATTFVFAADVVAKDDPKGKDILTSLFTYDDNSYDDIRKEKNITDEEEFLKETFSNSLDSLYEKYDIKKEKDYKTLKEMVISETKIVKYGYKVTDNEWLDDDNIILYIVDRKTNIYDFYKLNCRTKDFVKSSMDEWEEAKDKK